MRALCVHETSTYKTNTTNTRKSTWTYAVLYLCMPVWAVYVWDNKYNNKISTTAQAHVTELKKISEETLTVEFLLEGLLAELTHETALVPGLVLSRDERIRDALLWCAKKKKHAHGLAEKRWAMGRIKQWEKKGACYPWCGEKECMRTRQEWSRGKRQCWRGERKTKEREGKGRKGQWKEREKEGHMVLMCNKFMVRVWYWVAHPQREGRNEEKQPDMHVCKILICICK